MFTEKYSARKSVHNVRRIEVARFRKVMIGFLFVIMIPISTQAKDFGTVGQTYSVKEKDALTDIEEHVRATDWKKAMDKKKAKEKIENFKPEGLPSLPRAKENRSYLVDMTWTLPYDIPDGKGGILYPKGYSFNPLDYMNLPNTLVVLNGDDKKQVEWFQSSKYVNDPAVMLILSDGSYSKLMHKLKRPVFYANERIASRFNLQNVPAVVKQKGKFMEVTEYDVEIKKNH
jgi:conjugal transfer pilus assembly protein TraW